MTSRAIHILAVFAMVAGSTGALAQKFEVASVKPSQNELPQSPRFTGGPGTPDPERFTTRSLSLYNLLSMAYYLRGFEMIAPQWTETALFDVAAKIPPGASKAEFRLMLQDLLAERFQLKVHREKKEITAYDLEVKAGGIKTPRNGSDGLTPSGPPSATPATPSRAPLTVIDGNWHLQVRNETMDRFCTRLSSELKLPVNNSTDLPGTYDIGLTWARRQTAGAQVDGSDTESGPGLFTAVQEQLGLRLRPGKTVVDVLIVDRIEKMPSVD